MNKSIFEAVIGGVILLFIICLVYFASVYNSKDNVKYYDFVAYFDDATGVTSGTAVTVAGIKVGQVSEATFDLERKVAKVKFVVNESIDVPEDSAVKIIGIGFMGEKVLRLELGTEDNVLQPGDEVVYTQASSHLESLIHKFLFN